MDDMSKHELNELVEKLREKDEGAQVHLYEIMHRKMLAIAKNRGLNEQDAYACILELAEKTDDELPWSMEIIGDVTEAIKSTLENHSIKVRHPGVVTEKDGSQHYED